jgi:hypothetical protein
MSGYQLAYSSELMRNYLQAEVLAPDAEFEALQAEDGSSLLFSVGGDDTLYLTQEVPAERSGWRRTDLSTDRIRQDFPGRSGVAVRTFAAAESVFASPPMIHLAMVVGDGTQDHLYLSLSNPADGSAWPGPPQWTAYPFDDPAHQLSQLSIAGVFVSEATDAEYVVVDVLRNPGSGQQLVFRYYIDPAKTGGYAWHPHDLAIDLEAGRYSSCLGRRYAQYVDGLYTIGRVDGSPQFQYQPLYNVFNPKVPPSPSLYQLPGGAVPEAVAACRNPDDSTDLYITAAGTLYRLGSRQQQNGAVAAPVLSSPRLNGVRELFAESNGTEVTVWGLNGSNEVFYTAAAANQVGSGALAWSNPLPILTGVEQVSPYLDRANRVNTFFAHTGRNQLTKAVKSPDTGLWNTWQITLDPPNPNAPAEAFSSYTTRIEVTDTDTGQPAVGVPLTLTAMDVTAAYIDYGYYVLGPSPIQVTTDQTGAVTVVEPVTALAGTRLTATAGAAVLDINPMDHAFAKASALTTPAALTAAVITAPDGSTTPLIPPGTDPGLLRAVATGNTQLAQAYAQLPAATAALQARGIRARQVMPAATTLADPSALLVDVGDLFSWLGEQVEEGIDFAVQLIQDAATQLWNFAVTIGGQVYQCVLSSVEAVVGAAQWLYSALATAAEDLLHYLEFAFEWTDITRTKRILANLTQLSLTHEVAQISVLKGQFDQLVATVEQAVNNWAGVGDWSGLGTDGTAVPDTTSNPGAQQTAPGSLLAHHLQNNGSSLTTLQPLPTVPATSNPIAALLAAIDQEGQVIGDTIDRLQQLAADFDRLTVVEILKELAAVFADLVLESAKVVVDTLFDILQQIATAAVAVLSTPIHIPVVSDVLNDIGVPDFSFLDLACWVVAVPATVAYKLAQGTAPFPDTPESTFLATVSDYDTLVNAFQSKTAASLPRTPAARRAKRSATRPAEAAVPEVEVVVPPDVQTAVHIIGHAVSGFCSLFGGTFVSGFEAAAPTGANTPRHAREKAPKLPL